MNGAPGAMGRVHSNAGQGDNKASVRRFTISDSGKDVRNKIDQGALIFKSVEDFCAAYVDVPEKRRPIKKILVATNGIAAVRYILSIRRLLVQLFRDDELIKFICLTTEQEIRSNAEYLKLADFTVLSPGGDNRNNYANVDEIVSHAVEKEVDAVWAGWEHASENPELPRQLAARNIVFIGPPASAMFSLGDKIASTIIAQTVGIPTIEWSGSGIQLEEECQQGKVEVSQHLSDKACVSTIQEGLKAMEQHRIGYPMMIKASEGGGGKGIRKCKNEADFRENFVQVQIEVPGSLIYLMKCVENARHIEVQLIADRYGTVIPICTRDCSIQRRSQKIIEEAPASIAPESTLKKMQQDAVNIAQLVGYESAGTVEYMYLPSEDKYFFLKLNPRLQVEYPGTEMLANINIPAIQLQIAMGLPLNRIADVRLFYDLDRNGNSPLPKELVRTNTVHVVIAARITSEDPEDFFRPSTGSVEVLNFRSTQNVWGYFSVSGQVHEYVDSQVGHLFAIGRTRHEAVSVLLCALQELELRATFASQVSYLVDLLKEPDFTGNKFNTQWLDNRIANKVLLKSFLPLQEIVAISSAVIGHRRVETAFTNIKLPVERGQVLLTKDFTETFVFDLVKDMKIYKVMVTRTGPLNFRIDLNGGKTEVEIRTCGDGSLLVNHKERTYQCHLEETSDKFKVTIGRSLVVFEKDNDPTILKSPYLGKLLSYKKANRELVSVGVVFAQVVSMKRVYNVEVKKAPGRFVHVAKEGDLLYPGSVIARLVDQKDSEKYRPKPFTEKFIEWDSDDSMQKNLPEPNKLTFRKASGNKTEEVHSAGDKHELVPLESMETSVSNEPPVESTPWRSPRKVVGVSFSQLRPYLYATDGDFVTVHKYDSRKKCRLVRKFHNFGDNNSKTDISSWIQMVNPMSNEMVLVGSSNGTVRLWDLGFDSHSDEMRNEQPKLMSSFNPLASAMRFPFDVQEATRVPALYKWEQECGRLVTSGAGRMVRIWDAHAERVTIEVTFDHKLNGCVSGIASDFTGSHLFAVAFNYGHIRLYDERISVKESHIMQFDDHQDAVKGIALRTTNGKTVLSSADAHKICVYEPRMYKDPVVVIECGDNDEDVPIRLISHFDMHQNGQLMAAAFLHPEPGLRLFDISGIQVAQIMTDDAPFKPITNPTAIAFHPTRSVVALGTQDQILSAYGLPAK